MAPSTRKRKAAVNDTDVSGPSAQAPKISTARARNPQSKSKKTWSTKESRTSGSAGEDASDEGRKSSKQFLEAAKSSKRRRLNASAAKDEIRDNLNKVIAFMNDQDKGKEVFKLKTDLHTHFPSDLIPIMGHLKTQTDLASNIGLANPTLVEAENALNKINEMIKTYQSSNASERSIKKPNWMRWTQDQKDLDVLNQSASTAATRIISSLIVPNSNPDLINPPDATNDIGLLAWEFFADGRPQDVENAWGRVAQSQLKIFASLLRSTEEPKQKGS